MDTAFKVQKQKIYRRRSQVQKMLDNTNTMQFSGKIGVDGILNADR